MPRTCNVIEMANLESRVANGCGALRNSARRGARTYMLYPREIAVRVPRDAVPVW